MSPFPPVLRSSQVEQQRGSLLKGQLSWTSAHVVKFGYGFNLLQFCHMKKDQRKSHYFLCQLLNIQLLSSQWIDVFADSPSSLVLGPVPLSISSRAPGSLWGLSLERGDAEKEMKKTKSHLRTLILQSLPFITKESLITRPILYLSCGSNLNRPRHADSQDNLLTFKPTIGT